MDIYQLFIVMSIPSSITAFCFWGVKRQIEKSEKKREKREAIREQNEYLLVKSVGAAIALGEATAHALQRGHTNGDMEKALEYAESIKHEQKDFLQKQAMENIYQEG